MQNHRSLIRTAAMCGVGIAMLGCHAVAQDAPRGLDALNESRVLSELSRRNLSSLLEYAFEKNNTPPAQRDAIKASSALARLQHEKDMKPEEKRQLLQAFIKALPQLLPQMNDPQTLIDDVAVLFEQGIMEDQILLEYFGPNSTIMARLHPIAAGTQSMLARATELANAAAEKAQANWPAGKPAWEKADRQATDAEYTRQVLNYTFAITLDKASQERAPAIEQGLAYLPDFTGEESPLRNFAMVHLAKLSVAKGTKESLDTARGLFKQVIAAAKPDDVAQNVEARLMLVVTEMEAKNVPAAKTALADLEAWITAHKLEKQITTDAAISAMNYRLLNLQSELATGADKPKLASEAAGVLTKLLDRQPGLQPLILELLSSSLKPDTPVAQLEPVQLQALRAKAEAEVLKPDAEKFDEAAIKRGIDAAKEIIKRGGKDNDKVVADSMYALGFFYRKLGMRLEQANAFADYLDKYKSTNPERANVAFNNAGAGAGEVYRSAPGVPAHTKAYDRVLEIAVTPPFSRMEHAFEYARRLLSNGQFDKAMEMFAKVPADSPQYGDAQFSRLFVIQKKLEKVPEGDPNRAKLLADLQAQADKVNAHFGKQLTSATDAVVRAVIRSRLAQTRLLAADVAQTDQKNPARAIELLKDFETSVEGLPDAERLVDQALSIRVQAFMQNKQVTEATNELVRLAEKGKNVLSIATTLMNDIDEKRTQAEANKRFDLAAEYLANRAALTPFLVKWVRESNNADVKKMAYTVALFDASTQFQAAEAIKDDAKRKELLQAALKRFEELNSPPQVEVMLKQQREAADAVVKARDDLKKAPVPADANEKKLHEAKIEDAEQAAKVAESRYKSLATRKYDTQVVLGLGRVYFALNDYDKARMQFARLETDKVLGDFVIVRTDATGNAQEVENSARWESTYKLIKSNVSLNANVEGQKGWLRDLSANWQDKIGGARWGDEFKALMKELDIKPPAPAEAAKS